MDTTTIPTLEDYRRQRSQALTGMVGDLLGVAGGTDSSQPQQASSSSSTTATCEVILTQEDEGGEASASGIPPSPPPPGLFTDYTRKLSSMECCICLMPLNDTGHTESIADEEIKSLNAHLDSQMPATAAGSKGAKKITAAGKKRAREEEAAVAAAVASGAPIPPSADETTIEAIKETKQYVAQVLGDLARCQHVGVVGCGHMFHYSCIRKHLATRPGCPLCRQSINRIGYPPFPKGSQDRLPPPPPSSSSRAGIDSGHFVRAKQRVDHGTSVAAACSLLEGCCTTAFTTVMSEVSELHRHLHALVTQKRNTPGISSSSSSMVESWPNYYTTTEGIRTHLRAALVASPVYFLEEVYAVCRLATLTLLSSSSKEDGFFPSYPPSSSSSSSSSDRATVVDLLKEVLTLGKDRTDIKNWLFTVRSQYTTNITSPSSSLVTPHYNGNDWYEWPKYDPNNPSAFEMPHPLLIHTCRGPYIDVANTLGRKGELTGQLGSCELLLVWLSDLVSKRHVEGSSTTSATTTATSSMAASSSSAAPSSSSPPLSIMSSLLNYFTTPPTVAASDKRLSELRRANKNANLLKRIMPRLTWQLRRLLLVPGSSLHGHQDDFTHAVALLEATGSMPAPTFFEGRSTREEHYYFTSAAEGHPGVPPLGRTGVVSVKDAHNATKFQLAEPCINLLNIEAISAQYPLMLAIEAHKRHTVSSIKNLSKMVASSLDERVRSTITSPLSTATATGSGVNGGVFDGTMGGMVISSSSSQPSSPTTAITSPNTTTTSTTTNNDATSFIIITSGLSPVTLCAEYMQNISKEAHERRVQEKEVEKRRENLLRRRKIAEREVADLELWLQYAKEKEEVKRSLGYIEVSRNNRKNNITPTSTPNSTSTSIAAQLTQPLLRSGSSNNGGGDVEDLTGSNSIQNPFVTSTTTTTTHTTTTSQSLRPVRYGHDWAKNPFSPAGLQKAAQAADIPELMGDEGGKGVLRDTCAEIRNEVAYLEAEYKQQQDIERRSKRKLKELTELLAAYEEAANNPLQPGSGDGGNAQPIINNSNTSQNQGDADGDDNDDVKHEEVVGAPTTPPQTPSQQQCRIERYRSPAPNDEDRSTDDEGNDDDAIMVPSFGSGGGGTNNNVAERGDEDEDEEDPRTSSAATVPVSQRSATLGGGVGGGGDAEVEHLSDDLSTP